MGTTQSHYEDLAYDSWPFSQTHPDRLVTLATAYGMDPPPNTSDAFRMLELGCACGDNLIPLAYQHPQAEFLGVDASPRQIEAARGAAERLQLSNVRFECLDLRDMPAGGDPFDFIVSHGVYSWVQAEVRDRLLAVCREHLRPNGIAYVSYDVYPGCKTKDVVRDALQYHVQHFPDPKEQVEQALGFLKFLAEQVPNADPVYDQLFKRRLKSIGEDMRSETQLLHDLLVREHQPVYFHEFAEHAARHHLQYLAEADIAEMQSTRFPEQVAQVLQQLEGDWIRREQYLDFFKLRPFRQTLLCHRDVSVQRKLAPERLTGLLFASEVNCDTPDGNLCSTEPFQFSSPSGIEATVDHPLSKAALLVLREQWPLAMTFEDLETAGRRRLWKPETIVERQSDLDAERAALAEHLVQMYAVGAIEVHAHQPPFVKEVSQRPMASPWTRMQAERGRRVTNAWHTGVSLSDINRELILLLDGSRDRQQLIEDLSQQIDRKGLVIVHRGQPVPHAEVRAHLTRVLDEALATAASLALLVQ